MTEINRQRFLAELTQLLSFMYEEDRQYALEMYERMFDIAEDDEQELIQHLMSPTRQAVIIARAYDTKARSLTVSTRSKNEDDVEEEEGTPPFVLAINRIFDDLFPEEVEEEQPQEDQVSFFELGVADDTPAAKKPKMPRAATLLSDTQEFEAVTFPVEEEESEEAEEPESDLQEEFTEGETEDAPDEEIPEESEASADTPEPESESVGEQTDVPEEEETTVPEPIETEPAEQTYEIIDAIIEESAFGEPAEKTTTEGETAEETILVQVTEEITPEPEGRLPETDEPDAEPKPAPVKRKNRWRTKKTPKSAETSEQPIMSEPDTEEPPKPQVFEKKASIPLLVLFLILAIPLTVALLFLLAVLAALCLSSAVGLIALGAVLVVAAFSGFAVLADILLLLGASIVVLALGLLLLWLGIWLIGVVMTGLVRGVKELCVKWCWKEVPAE